MRRVKSSNTTPERALRKQLWSAGMRGWRLPPKHIPGKPDIAFTRAKLAIFIDGCFWHGCSTCYRRPKSHQTYWDTKLKRNMARDSQNTKDLRRAGWTVLRLWEHQVAKSIDNCTAKTAKALKRIRP